MMLYEHLYIASMFVTYDLYPRLIELIEFTLEMSLIVIEHPLENIFIEFASAESLFS
jgi:hypothetical protein